MCGDNFYYFFFNFYMICGSLFWFVDDWICLLDYMWRFDLEVLVSSYTVFVIGCMMICEVFTSYWDGIQWVCDEVVRGVNVLVFLEVLVDQIVLFLELVEFLQLWELYG